MAGDNGKGTKYEAQPKSDSYEFGGPLGALGVVIAAPFFAYWLPLACASAHACPPWPLPTFLSWHKDAFGAATSGDERWWAGFWSNDAALVYGAWYAWTVVCWRVLPGEQVQGVPMRNGERKLYKMNAFKTLVATLLAVGAIVAVKGAEPLTFVSEHWIELVSASLAMSALQACAVYAQSYMRKDDMLALGGNTPSVIYNWFIGRGLNPSIGSFDIKSFNELRPGMILWLVIDLAMVARQYADRGAVTDSIVLVTIFHSWYIVDALYNESAILSTMDITTDGFGFMLAFGDLVWVPFTYSYQAYFLALHPVELGPVRCAGVLAVQLAGYWVFRASNSQKNEFRQGRNPRNLKSMQTKRGTKLLIEGWWGLSQHPNYLGDWLMAWAWCLPCGFSTPLPYFYVVYFAILLVHRQTRDDHACHLKYGDDWVKYKQLVPSRIIPYVY